MARATFRQCRCCEAFHEMGAWPDACRAHWGVSQRSALAAPMLIRDSMDPVVSMISGGMFDSKRGYERHVRENGCQIVGDDRAPFDRKPEFHSDGVGQDLKRAIEELGG